MTPPCQHKWHHPIKLILILKCSNARWKHQDWLTDCFISAFAHSISSGGEELSYSSNPHLTWGWLWSRRKGSCALSLLIHHLWNDIITACTCFSYLLFIHHTQMGQTALHIAAEMGKVDVVEMILKAGVDLEIQDRVTDRVWTFYTAW